MAGELGLEPRLTRVKVVCVTNYTTLHGVADEI
jgi:hypothetical protein